MKIQQLYVRQPILAVDPVRWAERIRTIRGRKFSFAQREYLHELYRDPAENVLVKKARQLEITELAVNICLYWATSRPYTKVVYVSPRSDQVGRVSKDRVDTAIKYSQDGILLDAPAKGEKSVERKKFNNESIIYFITGWGEGDAIRNIDADVIVFDEVQDLTDAAIDSAKEAASHSTLKKYYYIGSPKLAGSGFERRWKQSDMKEWIDNAWTPTRKDEGKVYYSGYHLSQLMASWITPEEIEKKRETMTDQQFTNEVLGEFYAGGQVKLTLEEIMELCEWNRPFHHQVIQAPAWTVAGIDWGKPCYMKVMDENGRIIYATQFDKESIRGDPNCIVDKLMQQFNIRLLVCDMGYGEDEVAALQDRWASRVMGCWFVKRDDIIIIRDYQKNKDKTEMKSRPLLNANRTKLLDKVYEFFHKKKYNFPYHKSCQAEMQIVFDHYLALFERLTEPTMYASGRRIYESMGPDHYMFALAYATAAYLYLTGLVTSGDVVSEPSEFAEAMEEENESSHDSDLDQWRQFNWTPGIL